MASPAHPGCATISKKKTRDAPKVAPQASGCPIRFHIWNSLGSTTPTQLPPPHPRHRKAYRAARAAEEARAPVPTCARAGGVTPLDL